MGRRLDLQTLLEAVLGSSNVYFQPPESKVMLYPCITYKRDRAETAFANNNPYMSQTCYQLTIIDRDPDSLIPGRIARLPKCTFDRHYTANNLNHDIYKIFY